MCMRWGSWHHLAPRGLPTDEVKLLVDAQCLLDVQVRGFVADAQDDGLVHAHVRFQFLPQFWNGEQAVGIQFPEPSLPWHEH